MTKLDFLTPLSSLFWPRRCLYCNDNLFDRAWLCDPCHARLSFRSNGCNQCAERLDDPFADRCGRCILTPPAFNHTVALFNYQEPIKSWLHDYKYHRHYYYAKAFSALFAQCYLTHVSLMTYPVCLVPIPHHRLRIYERGFDHTQLLCRFLSRHLDLPYDNKLSRTKHTQAMAGLSAKERKRAIRKSFQCAPINNQHIILVDDIMTTSATTHEAASTLMKSGAASVEVWVIARA